MPTQDNLNYTVANREALARYCAIEGIPEVQKLEFGMDFRRPEFRREVWMRFYEFHLRYRSHPGAVYYVFPFLAKKYRMNAEQRLWFAFINGNSQHPVTTLTIFKRFPDFASLNIEELARYFNENYKRFGWDTDRRYHKKSFIDAVKCYKQLAGESQEDFFLNVIGDTEDEGKAFGRVWDVVSKKFFSFGRLSTFSYLEYLRIMGMPIDCDRLFMDDMSGSKSHRNGLAKVLGRDDLDWHKNTGFEGTYGPGQIEWFAKEGEQLLKEARVRFADAPFKRDVGYFTMESTFCTYKGWHRKNRRYPNVYNDMFFNRIRASEQAMPEEDYSDFWEARKKMLPANLRLEDNPADPGLVAEKQNHYRETGQVIMMDEEWSCFKNDFNDKVNEKQLSRLPGIVG